MATRSSLKGWVIEALKDNGGRAYVADIARHIWENHETELRTSGKLFYTWQYDMRWAADRLRAERKLQPKPRGDRGPWRLASGV